VQPARPLTVDCVSCATEIVIDGTKHEAEGTTMFCRHCHGEYEVPKAETLASYHCNECGQINEIRAVGAAESRA
jgi:DNA-directed RNA polymerase subunit RPC12/RpoP